MCESKREGERNRLQPACCLCSQLGIPPFLPSLSRIHRQRARSHLPRPFFLSFFPSLPPSITRPLPPSLPPSVARQQRLFFVRSLRSFFWGLRSFAAHATHDYFLCCGPVQISSLDTSSTLTTGQETLIQLERDALAFHISS